jgi:hypothetical protein
MSIARQAVDLGDDQGRIAQPAESHSLGQLGAVIVLAGLDFDELLDNPPMAAILCRDRRLAADWREDVRVADIFISYTGPIVSTAPNAARESAQSDFPHSLLEKCTERKL